MFSLPSPTTHRIMVSARYGSITHWRMITRHANLVPTPSFLSLPPAHRHSFLHVTVFLDAPVDGYQLPSPHFHYATLENSRFPWFYCRNAKKSVKFHLPSRSSFISLPLPLPRPTYVTSDGAYEWIWIGLRNAVARRLPAKHVKLMSMFSRF